MSRATDTALSYDGISFGYSRRSLVVRDFTWQVGSGRTALLGPNGAGKSTLLAIAATVLRPRVGHVEIGSMSWPSSRPSEYRARIGYMPQSTEFVPHLTVRQNVQLFGWLKQFDRNRAVDLVVNALRAVDLIDLANERAGSLSGGQQRRLCLAQAIVHEPEVLLLDEPTVGLDPAQREGFRQVLVNVPCSSVLISTHQVDEIDDLVDRVTVLSESQIRYTGTYVDFLQLAEPGRRQADRAYLSLLPGLGG